MKKKYLKKNIILLKAGIKIGHREYNLETILKRSNTNWIDAEWGFPKGRRNYQEKDLTCALREFEEETGYNKSSVNIVQNIIPYEEVFTGSN